MNKEYCPLCDQEMTHLTNQSKKVKLRTPNGIKEFELQGLSFYKCNGCNETLYTPEDSELHDLKMEEYLNQIRKEKGLLTAGEIKQIRSNLGLSQEQLEEILGVGKKSFARWETNKVDQSKAIDWLLRIIGKKGINVLDEVKDNPFFA